MWCSRSMQIPGALRSATHGTAIGIRTALDPFVLLGRFLDVHELAFKRERASLQARQDFLCQPQNLAVMLMLLGIATYIGIDLYQSGAALPLAAGYLLLPPAVVMGLLFRGLRPVDENEISWEIVVLRPFYESFIPLPLQRPPAAPAQ
jgi:hypothetical protein